MAQRLASATGDHLHPPQCQTRSPGSLDGAHAGRPDRNWVGSSSLLPLAVDVLSTRRNCADRCGDASTIGTTAMVDIRVPIVLILLVVASLDCPVLRRRWLILVALILGTVCVVRMAVITDHWHETDRHYRQFVQALDRLPQGACLFLAIKLSSHDAYSPAEGMVPEPMPRSIYPAGVSSGDQRSSRSFYRPRPTAPRASYTGVSCSADDRRIPRSRATDSLGSH